MTQAIATKKPPYLLMYIVTLVYLVVTAFFEEGVAYFDPVYTTLMSSTEFYLTFSLCVVLFLTEIYIAKHYFGIRINWVFFSLVVLLFLIDVVAILSFPEWTVLTGVYHVTVSLRLRYITFWLAACMAFYVFFAIMPKTVNSVNAWNIYFILAIIIALSSVIYSYFHDYSSYAAFFDPNSDIYLYKGPVSFTNNRNTYGTLLLVGLASSIYLSIRTGKIYYDFFSLFFFLNEIAIFSRSSLICSMILFAFAFVFKFCKTVKAHPIIATSSFLVIMTFVLLLIFAQRIGFTSNPLVSKFYSAIINNFDLSKTMAAMSIDGRFDIWEIVLGISSNSVFSLLFGVGDWNFSWFLGFSFDGSLSYIESSHNGFLDVLGRHGLIGLFFYVALICFILVSIFKNLKNHHSESLFNLFFLICVLVHGLVEDTNLFNMQAKPMMLLFMSAMPILTQRHLDKYSRDSRGWEFEYSSSVFKKVSKHFPMSSIPVLFFSFLSVFSAILIGLSQYFSYWEKWLFAGSVFFQLQIFLVSIFYPVFVYMSVFHQTKQNIAKARYLFIAGSIWFLSCTVLSFFFYNPIMFSFFLISGILILFIGLLGFDKKSFITMGSFSIFFFGVEVLLILISELVIRFCMVPDEIFQPYAAMCLIILDLILPFMIMVASPLHTIVQGSFDDRWRRVEDSYRFIGYRHQVKYEIRLMKATQRKPLLRNQK